MNRFSEAVGRFFLNRRNLFIIGFVLTAVLTFLEVSHGKQLNFFTFRNGTLDFWQGLDPYGKEKYDFLYGPIFAMLFLPFAWLGTTVGPFVWNLFNFSMFFWAVFTLPRLTEQQKCKSYLFTALILATTQMSMQFNPVVAYLFLFAFTLLENGRPREAVLLILVSGFCKIYGIFELGLLLCYPRFWRNAGFALAVSVLLVVLPAAVVGIDGLIPFYRRWVEVLGEHVDQFHFYAVFNLRPLHDLLTPVMTQVQLGALAVLALLFGVNYRRFGNFAFRAGSVGVLMGWVILFSLSTEKHTYVIALTGFMLWYWAQNRRALIDRVLFWCNWILLVAVPVDLLCPSPLMHLLCDTLQLNIYCFTITWLRMIYVTFFRPITDAPALAKA